MDSATRHLPERFFSRAGGPTLPALLCYEAMAEVDRSESDAAGSARDEVEDESSSSNSNSSTVNNAPPDGTEQELWLSDQEDEDDERERDRWDARGRLAKRIRLGKIQGANQRMSEQLLTKVDPAQFYAAVVKRHTETQWATEVEGMRDQMREKKRQKEELTAAKEAEKEEKRQARQEEVEERRQQRLAETERRRAQRQAETEERQRIRREETEARRAAGGGRGRGRGRGGAAAAGEDAAPARRVVDPNTLVPRPWASEEAAPPDTPNALLCAICLTNLACCAPNCGHKNYCVACSRGMLASIARGTATCAICRGNVERITRVFG